MCKACGRFSALMFTQCIGGEVPKRASRLKVHGMGVIPVSWLVGSCSNDKLVFFFLHGAAFVISNAFFFVSYPGSDFRLLFQLPTVEKNNIHTI